MINRKRDITNFEKLLDLFPATAILGARQCGKTTLAKHFAYDHFFDLENPRDLARLENPQLALESLSGLIIIDEIQRKPNLFPLLRYLIDNNPKQKYLILGSASRDLIQQSSETLAGRIAYYLLKGFSISDIGTKNINCLLQRGGFPRSFLANTEEASVLWRENYITTFLERDLPQLGISIPSAAMRRFWTMLSHYHGQTLNYSELGRSFGVSDHSILRYLEILEGTFMIRILRPWHNNTSKRLVKAPKIYFRDSGIFHTLQSVESEQQLLTHPKLGASWEGFALEMVCHVIGKQNEEIFFWGTHGGAELDLFWKQGGRSWGAEFKYTDAPRLTTSMKTALTDLDLSHLWVIYPGTEKYLLEKRITVLPLSRIDEMLQ